MENTQRSSIKPLKIGVRFKQPAIILLYEDDFKYRKRIMPLRGLKKNSSVSIATSELKERHPRHLANVPNFKIEKMLRLIQNDMKGLDLEESLLELEKEFTVDPEENLNEVDDARLQRKKEIMDLTFEKNRKKPGDPDFEYDVEVDFSQVAGMETSVWDSEKEENSAKQHQTLKIGVRFKQSAIILHYEDNSKYEDDSKYSMPLRGLKKNSSLSIATCELKESHYRHLPERSQFQNRKMLRLIQNDMKGLDLEESLLELEKESTEDPEENLNEVDDARLQRKKEIMDLTFGMNRKKPGDQDFEYDVEVDFSSG